jgi:hypothetical protein
MTQGPRQGVSVSGFLSLNFSIFCEIAGISTQTNGALTSCSSTGKENFQKSRLTYEFLEAFYNCGGGVTTLHRLQDFVKDLLQRCVANPELMEVYTNTILQHDTIKLELRYGTCPVE